MNGIMPLYIILHISAFAFFIALAISGFMIAAGVLDTPDYRSSHEHVTPTAGGVGIVAALGLGMLACAHFYPALEPIHGLGAVLALALAIAFLGLIDDTYAPPTKLKFMLITLICALAVWVVGAPQGLPMSRFIVKFTPWAAFLGATLWMFVITNSVNFMDGINGLMGATMAAAFIGLSLLSLMSAHIGLSVVCGVMAAGLLGFLPYNFKSKADIFCGDVGSLLVGFMYGVCVLALVANQGSESLIYLGVLFVLPLLVDVLLTLLGRARNKQNLLSPHRDHLYQKMTQNGFAPIIVSLIYTALSAVLIVFGLLSASQPWPISLYLFIISVVVLSLVYALAQSRFKRRAAQQNPPDG